MPFVSRAGDKLEHALARFEIPVAGRICADLGCNAGGFTDCLLQRGAVRVYAIDTGYGALDYKLRKDPRVVVMERTNALHAVLPEKVSLIVIDVAFTRQKLILPAARTMLAPGGDIVTLLKPQYEAPKEWLTRGILQHDKVHPVLGSVEAEIAALGFSIEATTESPITGAGGNVEALAWLRMLPPSPLSPPSPPTPPSPHSLPGQPA